MQKRTILFIALLAVPSFAATINVNWDGTGDYTTIQEGINAAVNGDTIVVAPGTYYENLSVVAKSIVLQSVIPEEPSLTVINGSDLSSVIHISNCPDISIEGFTITNGLSDHGGGLYCSGTSDITIDNCIIVNNSARNGSHATSPSPPATTGKNGGGIYCAGGVTMTIWDSIINNNNAGDGGNGWCGGNQRTPGKIGGSGGAIYFVGTSLSLINTEFNTNSSGDGGGGDFCMEIDPDGADAGHGGGIYICWHFGS